MDIVKKKKKNVGRMSEKIPEGQRQKKFGL